MRYVSILNLVGLLLMLFSFSMVPPFVVAAYYQDGAQLSFVIEFLITFFSGFLLWFPLRHFAREFKTRDGFLVVALIWVVLGFYGAIPFYMNVHTHLSFTNSIFVSVSGLTTTGASVITHLNDLPKAILYYRQQLHLLGGLSIIVLAVAIFPLLEIGGMQLYRAEMIGGLKAYNIRPRITETAKALWYIYLGLVVLCALCYWLAGMTVFDAVGESFSTIATGGFSMHNSSFAYYHSNLINCICIFFMILGATNFTLHFQFFKQRSFFVYSDSEFVSYLKILFTVSVITILVLVFYHYYVNQHANLFVNGIFTVVSMASTTGFTTTNFMHWPTFLPYLLVFVGMLGGCGGSTAGGIKVIRYILLRKQGGKEITHLIHPKAVTAIKLGRQTVSNELVQSVFSYLTVYLLLFLLLFLLLLATGLPLETAFGTLAACISNAGAAIGLHGFLYQGLPDTSKWILIFAMILGRLEIFTVLILFTPSYWRN